MDKDYFMNGFKWVCLVTLITGILITSYKMGEIAASSTNIEPQRDFIWINNNRVHVDSLITTRPIFNASGEQEGLWVKVTYQGSDVFIECVDELGYTWEEWSESWLMAFKEETE